MARRRHGLRDARHDLLRMRASAQGDPADAKATLPGGARYSTDPTLSHNRIRESRRVDVTSRDDPARDSLNLPDNTGEHPSGERFAWQWGKSRPRRPAESGNCCIF